MSVRTAFLMFTLLGSSLIFSTPVFAQNNTAKASEFDTVKPISVSTVKEDSVTQPSARVTKTQGAVRIEASSYPTDIPENTKLSRSTLATIDFRSSAVSAKSESAIDLSAGKYVDWGGSLFAVEELYTSYVIRSDEAKTQFAFGRKMHDWSTMDSVWKLGMWQPHFTLDALRPEEQGLTGFFFLHERQNFAFTGFASPLFVPTMGPEVSERNGNLVSDSRWYRQPSGQFSMGGGRNVRLLYSLNTPDIQKLVQNPGAGLQMKFGGKKGGFVDVAAGYKPINALLLHYDPQLVLTETETRGEATVAPVVGYHTLATVDAGFRNEKTSFVLSTLADRPAAQQIDEQWVEQVPQPIDAYSATAAWGTELPYKKTPLKLSASYLRVVGGGIRDQNSRGEDQGAIFESRVNFTNAILVGVESQNYLGSVRLDTQFRALRDFDQKGALYGLEFNLYPTRSLALVAGADILGPDDRDPDNSDGRFLNQFRANDRYYGGLSYAF